MAVTLASIRRYPVKAMGGEGLDHVDVDDRGLAGDRWYAVVDPDGRLASHKDTRRMRRRDAVAGYRARTDGAGLVVVADGQGRTWPVEDPALAAHLGEVMGATVTLEAESGTSHQDDGAVSVVGTATLRWCAERWDLDADPRRLRVNLVVDTDEPFVEETWVGRSVAVGSVLLAVEERIERCRTVDVPQDGTSATGRWFKPLAAERDMSLAVYARVLRPGPLAVGDAVVPS
ncbi:MOSC domain-containing protein [Aquipuribacter sp. MA13-6]|uniref:MOSC domain-containing protein n=1 Tax=unclassified Aquipuribacter TaxID=2635084 RepID=UPI003EEB93A5